MKKIIAAVALICMMLTTLSSCHGSSEESENNIAYGRVVKTDENTITVESGSYKYEGEFKGSGREVSYNLPEHVFFDDFKKGDIVAVLLDGKDATAVSNVKDAEKSTATEASPDMKNIKAVVKADGEELEINDKTYQSEVNNETVMMAVDERGRLDVDRTMAGTLGRKSPGMITLGGGLLEGSQVTVTTAGQDSPAVKACDGNSIIEFENSTLETEALRSPCVESAGNVSLSNVTATAQSSSAISLINGGIVNLKGSNVVSFGENAFNIAAGKSQDSGSKLTIDHSTVESKGNGALIKITGAKTYVKMIGSQLMSDSDTLVDIRKDKTGNGARLLLYGVDQTFEGSILCDRQSKVKVVLTEGSIFTGALNTAGTAAYSKICLSKESVWNLTADSYAGSIVNGDETCANINSNGFNIFYDSSNVANKWLGGRTVELQGGGLLTPKK